MVRGCSPVPSHMAASDSGNVFSKWPLRHGLKRCIGALGDKGRRSNAGAA